MKLATDVVTKNSKFIVLHFEDKGSNLRWQIPCMG